MLKISGIRDAGSLEKERLVMVAKTATELAEIVMIEVGAKPDESVNAFSVKGGYWFPTQTVKAGDLVILYTKAGRAKRKENLTGTISHFYYRGLDKAVWGQAGFVSLGRVSEWENYSSLIEAMSDSEDD